MQAISTGPLRGPPCRRLPPGLGAAPWSPNLSAPPCGSRSAPSAARRGWPRRVPRHRRAPGSRVWPAIWVAWGLILRAAMAAARAAALAGRGARGRGGHGDLAPVPGARGRPVARRGRRRGRPAGGLGRRRAAGPRRGHGRRAARQPGLRRGVRRRVSTGAPGSAPRAGARPLRGALRGDARRRDAPAGAPRDGGEHRRSRRRSRGRRPGADALAGGAARALDRGRRAGGAGGPSPGGARGRPGRRDAPVPRAARRLPPRGACLRGGRPGRGSGGADRGGRRHGVRARRTGAGRSRAAGSCWRRPPPWSRRWSTSPGWGRWRCCASGGPRGGDPTGRAASSAQLRWAPLPSLSGPASAGWRSSAAAA